MGGRKVVLVVPSIARDISYFFKYVELYFKYLPIREICIIGNAEVRCLIPQNERISFIDEGELIDIPNLKKNYQERHLPAIYEGNFGWYLQQFIKIAYSKRCSDDYYLLWDSDTLPLKEVELFDKLGKPYFDYKAEYHKPYFETIGLLFTDLSKHIDYSFISEHMLINTAFMLALIKEVEDNDNLIGSGFEEKIINSMSIDLESGCSFSEFETYGNYVNTKFPGSYSLRRWRSMRYGGFYFSTRDINSNSIIWLSKRYDAISFEKKHILPFGFSVVREPLFQMLFSPIILEPLRIIRFIMYRISK